MMEIWYDFGLPPNPGCQSQRKVYRDSLRKMKCHPGGDWNPAWGVVPRYDVSHVNFQSGLIDIAESM